MRRLLLVLAGLIVLVAAGAAGWWYWLAGRTEQAVVAWIDQRRASGELVEYAGIHTDGFPLAIRLHVAQPKLGRVGPGWRWLWTGDALVAEAPVWAPDRIGFKGEGTQVVTGEVGREPRPLRLDVSGLFGTVQPEDGRWTVRAHGYDLRLIEQNRPEKAYTAAAANLLIGYPNPTGRVRVAVNFDNICLPDEGPLGDTVAFVDADAEIDVPLPANESAAALSQWRDAGGKLDLARFGIGYGALNLEAGGSVALDNELRPVGKIDGRVQGWEPVIDALIAKGMVQAKGANSVKLLLGLMAKPGKDNKPTLEAPLTLADGQLRLGPLTLLPLEPLAR